MNPDNIYAFDSLMEDANPVSSASPVGIVDGSPVLGAAPVVNTQTLPAQTTPAGGLDAVLNALESVWNSAYPILVQSGAITPPSGGQGAAAAAAQAAAEAEQKRMLVTLGVAVIAAIIVVNVSK